MELRNLRTFLRAAELGSFSAAARDLGYSQATITVQIQQLEAELDTVLFERIGRRIRLTHQGQLLADRAAPALQELTDACTAVKSESEMSGSLRLVAVESICSSMLAPVISEFYRTYPDIQLSVISATNPEMWDMLESNDADLILYLDRRIARPSMTKLLEFPEPMVFVAAPDHPLANDVQPVLTVAAPDHPLANDVQAVLSAAASDHPLANDVQAVLSATASDHPLSAIAAHPLILTELGLSYQGELEICAEHLGVHLEPQMIIGNTDLIAKTLQATDTISYLPRYVVGDLLQGGQLVEIPCSQVHADMWSQLACHRRKIQTPAMRAFVQTLRRMHP